MQNQSENAALVHAQVIALRKVHSAAAAILGIAAGFDLESNDPAVHDLYDPMEAGDIAAMHDELDAIRRALATIPTR